jgi:methyltransferase (TIGR00027 family)
VDIKVFEIDHPGTQARKRHVLEQLNVVSPANLSFIPMDFNRCSIQEVLADHDFSVKERTLFLCEGVSYYLPQSVVEGLLDFVASCAAGSSIVFDYATRRFVDGNTSTYGSRRVSRWLKKIGEPFLFGLDPDEAKEFFRSLNLQIVSDLGPEELEKLYLNAKDGRLRAKTLGHIRMVHAKAAGCTSSAEMRRGRAQPLD